jgi:serine/threonine protein kinase
MAAAAGTMFRCPGNNSRVVDRDIAVSRLSNYGMVNDLGAGLSGTVCLVKHARTGELYVAKAMKWAKRRAGDGAAAAEAREREQQQREQALSQSRRSLGDTARRSSAYSQFSAISTGTAAGGGGNNHHRHNNNNPIYNNMRRSGAVGLNSSSPHPGAVYSPNSARNTNNNNNAIYSSPASNSQQQQQQAEPPMTAADKQHIEFLKKVARQDVELLSNCAHPNVVEYIDSIETDSVIFLVMEYLDGGDLKAELVNRKKIKKAFSPVSAMRFFVQMLLSVQFLHERGVFHRDVKPSNFMMKQVLPTAKSSPELLEAIRIKLHNQQQQEKQREATTTTTTTEQSLSAPQIVEKTQQFSPPITTSENTKNNNNNINKTLPSDTLTSYCNKFVLVKLGDFGFALRSHEERGDAAGTPAYAAPEMYSPVTHTTKADIWSLGVLLYELVTLSKPPVTGTDFARMCVREAEKKFHEEGLSYPNGTPDYVRDIVAACLVFNPEKRPSAGDLFRRFPSLVNFGLEYVEAYSLLRPDQHGMKELREQLLKYRS